MNERIKELAEQARYDARNEKHYLERVHNREFTVDEYQEIYDRKFAELIVGECSEQVMSIGRYNTPSGITPDLAIAISVGLKKHFGVEE